MGLLSRLWRPLVAVLGRDGRFDVAIGRLIEIRGAVAGNGIKGLHDRSLWDEQKKYCEA